MAWNWNDSYPPRRSDRRGDRGGDYRQPPRRDYPDERGYPPYQPPQPYFRQDEQRYPNLKYKLGQRCKVISLNEPVIATIIRVGREQYECRMPDLSTVWFFEHELESLEESNDSD